MSLNTKKFFKNLIICLIILISTHELNAQGVGTQFGSSAENPSISAIGTIFSRFNTVTEKPSFGLSDAELGFQSPIDPYARFDMLLHYNSGLLENSYGHNHDDGHEHSSGFDVEEALITLTSLPGRFQASFGRMRSRIGIVNVMHLHDFNFAEYPEIISRYWGEEGLSVDGTRVSWLAPLPFWAEVVIEGKKQNSEEESDFATGGINVFFPFGDEAGLTLTGFGYFDKQNGDNPMIEVHEHSEESVHDRYVELSELIGERNTEFNGYGAGFRYKWQPVENALYRHLIVQSEIMGKKLLYNAYKGFYIFSEYKYARRWTFGGMVQRTEYPLFDDDLLYKETSSGISAALSFFPSDFQRVRFQFDRKKAELTNNIFSIQWTFIIGPHKPHSY